MKKPKVLVIGLDGGTPEFIFEKFWDKLPNLRKLGEAGVWQEIETTTPAVTPPAWTSMLTGKNPGKFGFWDFVFRRDFSYGEKELVGSGKIESKPLYSYLDEAGLRCALINLAVSYPPIKLKNGICIGSFLNPDNQKSLGHPENIYKEVEDVLGEPYLLDAARVGVNFRDIPKDEVYELIKKMDGQRFTLLKHYLKKVEFDFVMTVIMGTDRLGHLLVNMVDENHVHFDKSSKLKNAYLDHLQFVDREIGEVLKFVDEDTYVFVLSDHTVQRLDSRFNFNDWLYDQSYLKLKSGKPKKPTTLAKADVDWAQTIAWSEGFMEARFYINLKGREAQGAVEKTEFEKVKAELQEKIKTITDQNGKPLKVEIIERESVMWGPYAKYGPDFLVRLNDANWANNAVMGYDNYYSYNTPIGEDEGTHGNKAIFIGRGQGLDKSLAHRKIKLFDLTPTILKIFDIEAKEDFDGKSLI
ncbi:MAG: hypothetical protein A2826_02455 [Candidatus Doudnabacteria bacterium RIFCSPHIGHO2_01_FULL_43_23]|uniref:Phosphodiesterase n=1 Tax=Candidatus Doudnabacteria bacterium RIFCSPHIGHO2_01_FULL_43_23 TaxID=1817822 RepID=A0A1F5NTM7_9BACT|nr:MAG: hypothetical protein A2826_02455 [Candidatus Doudnabacteria bacterium RIFCSPHIGHO2_01_FULL_43_23]